MRGLLRNNFYSMSDCILLSAVIVALLALVALFVESMLSWIITVAIFMYPINIGASLQTDETSKWMKFEITMPVSRKTIVQCKYLSYLMLVVIGIMSSLLIVFLATLMGHDLDMTGIFRAFSTGLSVALLVGAFMYPLILISSATKSELIIIASAIVSVVIITLLGAILVQVMGSATATTLAVRTALVIISALCLVASYFVSVHLHRKKEF